MLRHDITNDKYYSDEEEVTKEEYDALWKKWHDNLPPPPPVDPEPEFGDAEAFQFLFGGDAE